MEEDSYIGYTNADLLAKVSEQEKEIEALKIMVKEKYYYMTKPLTFENKEVSEQSQRIEALTKENERLKERIDTDWYVLELRNDANRLLQERKDLVEALREVLKTTLLMPELELKVEYLLSKFEVPNT